MPRYIAFLRGINVSGQKLVKMDALKSYFEMPGFSNIVTYIQSGNVLFDTPETDKTPLTDKIEKQLAEKLGFEVKLVLRTLDEIRKVIERNPFADSMNDENRKLYITFLSGTTQESLHNALHPWKNELEELKVVESELYIMTNGIGNSKLTLTLIERKLGFTATMRNWATVNKVVGM